MSTVQTPSFAYKFEETARPYLNCVDGSVSPFSELDDVARIATPLGFGLDFNGTTDDIRAPSSVAWNVGNQNFMRLAIVKFDDVSGGQGPTVFAHWKSSGNIRSHWLGLFSSKPAFLVSPNGSTSPGVPDLSTVANTVQANVTLSTGVWYLIFVWHDATADVLAIQVCTPTSGPADATVYTNTHTTGVHAGTSGAVYVGSVEGANFLNGQVECIAGINSDLWGVDARTAIWNEGNYREFCESFSDDDAGVNCGEIKYGDYEFSNLFHISDEGIRWTVPRTLLPRRPGGRLLTAYREPRAIQADGGIVKGPFDTSDFQTRLDALVAALETGATGVNLYVREDRHYRNVEVEEFVNRYGPTGFCRIADAISIRFISPHGFEFSNDLFSDIWSSPATGGTRTINTAGDAFSLPQWKFTVSTSGTLTLTFNNTTTGETFTLSGAVVGGDVIIVDTLDETVTIAGSNQMDMFDGSWARLDPGANLVSVTYSGVTVSQIETKWRDRW